MFLSSFMSTTVQGFYNIGHGHTGQKLFNVAMDLAEMGFGNQKVETLRMVDPGDRSADQRDPKSVGMQWCQARAASTVLTFLLRLYPGYIATAQIATTLN